MRHYKLFLEGAELYDGHTPQKFDTIIEATDEHHARVIYERDYGYFTLTHIVEIMGETHEL